MRDPGCFFLWQKPGSRVCSASFHAALRPGHCYECAMKRPINPAAIRAPFAQYSHAVEVPAGRMLFASGQLGVSPDDHVPEDAEAQAVLCFENIKAILADAGMSFADVVRFTAFVTDRAYFPVYGAVRSRYVAGNAFASTLVIVSGFTRVEFKVEVEVTAVRSS
jgi:2-iminobutanoate/2-iminopropanoate deaminase